MRSDNTYVPKQGYNQSIDNMETKKASSISEDRIFSDNGNTGMNNTPVSQVNMSEGTTATEPINSQNLYQKHPNQDPTYSDN